MAYILKADNRDSGAGWGGYFGGRNKKYYDLYDYTTRECAKRFGTVKEAEQTSKAWGGKFIVEQTEGGL